MKFNLKAWQSLSDPDQFINEIDKLQASGGEDNPEPMVEAMRAAAIRCPPRSTIFLFTDAPDKDNRKADIAT